MSKRFFYALAFVCLSLWPSFSFAQEDLPDILKESRSRALKGLTKVIVIQPFGFNFKGQPSRSDLRTLVELRLRQSGITLVSVDEEIKENKAAAMRLEKRHLTPTLYVDLTALDAGTGGGIYFIASLRLEIELPASSKLPLGFSSRLIAWEFSNAAYDYIESPDDIKKWLERALNEFCNDYLRANPK